jgi:tetratricopeptide (TPR) repeat protein
MTPRRRIRGFAAVAAAVLLAPAFAQIPSSSSPNGTASNPGSRTTLPGNSNGTNSTNNSGSTVTTPMIRVSGRVMVDDGRPPDFPATIERVCNGSPYTEGYTDSKGYFSVTLGQAVDVIQDASEIPGSSRSTNSTPGVPTLSTTSAGTTSGRSLGVDRLANCELRARLGGYTSKSIDLSGRSSMDSPEIGVILLHHMGASETATTVTPTSLKAPKEARKALQKGLDLEKKNMPEEAIASLQEAVKVYPEFAFAWFEMGKLQVENGHTPDGHESFEAAVKAEPRWPEPYLQLAVMALKAHDWREVAENTDHVLHLNSYEYPQAYFFNGAANFNLHRMDVAQKSLEAAERLDSEHLFLQVHQLLGIIYAATHRYSDAARELRSFVTLAPDSEDARAARQQLAVMEKMAAATPQTPPAAPKDQQ